jgi:hypothetical protein
VRAEVETTLRCLEASLLVGDPDPLADVLAWQAQALPAHGVQDPSALIDALAAALGSDFRGAAAMLSKARELAGV